MIVFFVCKLTDYLFRLVSFYYNKLSVKKRWGQWINLSKEIIKLYRCKQKQGNVIFGQNCNFPPRVDRELEEEDDDVPTPSEFIKLVTL